MVDTLQVVLRTPHGDVHDAPVASLRVPTETGQVGLRPRGEPLVLAVEPGLVVLRDPGGEVRFGATAGGLLETDGRTCTLLTPFAAVGSQSEVLAALDGMLATPESELTARRKLGELEQRIVQELGHRPPVPTTRGPDGIAG